MFPTEKLRCAEPTLEPGGGAVNVARVLHRLDRAARLVLPLGGPAGERLRATLNREGLDFVAVPIAAATRENLIVTERASGLQYRFVMPGPLFSDVEWRRLLVEIDEAEGGIACVVASGSLAPGQPEDLFAQVVRRAAAVRLPVAIDTSGPALAAALPAGPWVIKPNRQEFGALFETPPRTVVEIGRAAADLRQRHGIGNILVSLGADGACLAHQDGVHWLSAPRIEPVSAVGAGDSMTAAFVAAALDGCTGPEQLRRAVAAGAAALLTPGTELCRAQDYQMLLDRLGPPEALPC